ncbi:MAG: T9SS type A sorting domain-containing protein [Bacteroidales bacterium]|jgi:hypothetical protein|nr:T9SS type A sorting domain-containing protein [Bacteroidales bacterium]
MNKYTAKIKQFIVVAGLFPVLFWEYVQAQSAVVSVDLDGNVKSLPCQIMPAEDSRALLQADSVRLLQGYPLRVGTVQPVNLALQASATIDTLPDGTVVYRHVLISPGAFAVAVHLTYTRVPEGAELWLYTPDHMTVVTYTSEDLNETDPFLSSNLPGEMIVVEYREPSHASFQGELFIANLLHAYRDTPMFDNDTEYKEDKGTHGSAEGSCHIDINCPDAAAWTTIAKSVVYLEITIPSGSDAGTYLCTGTMLNNARNDKRLFLLTANHCEAVTGQGIFRVYFNYQSTSCNSTKGYGGDVYNKTVVIRARDNYTKSSDFLLLELTGTLTAGVSSNIYLAGWNRTYTTSSPPTAGACIHHPGGDFKKVSFPQSVKSGGTRFWEVSWKIGIYNQGVTEAGSSGSALFDANGLLVGQLYGGNSSCNYASGTDSYGRIGYSWTNGSQSDDAKKLQPWLDPDNTGTMTVDGTSLGISHIERKIIHCTVFPNPCSDKITLQGDFTGKTVTCALFNLMGQEVFHAILPASSEIQCTLPVLPNGMYILHLTQKDQVFYTKVVISK